MSRADLARRTGLTPATVSSLVTELGQSGLVREAASPRQRPRVGKPPTMLRIKPDARNVITIDLSQEGTITSTIVDMEGSVQGRFSEDSTGLQGAEALNLIKTLATRTAAEAKSPLAGVGISAPGHTTRGGVVLHCTRFDWHDLNLMGEIRSVLDLPVYIINDANAVALGEYGREGDHSTHLAVVTIGCGVGAGFVLNGELILGAEGGAGEIGHLVIDPAGPACPCGSTGCLETLVSVPALRKALAAGDPEIVRLTAANHLGIALAAIVSVLNVDRIIISGPGEVLGDEFCSLTGQAMRQASAPSAGRIVEIVHTSRGHDAAMIGASRWVLSEELGAA